MTVLAVRFLPAYYLQVEQTKRHRIYRYFHKYDVVFIH